MHHQKVGAAVDFGIAVLSIRDKLLLGNGVCRLALPENRLLGFQC
jgi:hypothetical protein